MEQRRRSKYSRARSCRALRGTSGASTSSTTDTPRRSASHARHREAKRDQVLTKEERIAKKKAETLGFSPSDRTRPSGQSDPYGNARKEEEEGTKPPPPLEEIITSAPPPELARSKIWC